MTASTGATLLLVEDKPSDADVIKRILLGHQHAINTQDRAAEIESIEHVTTLAAGIDRVTAGDIDVVLLDLGLPDSDGLETVSRMLEHASTVPVVVLTGQKGMGVDAIQRGAQDYLIKGQLNADALTRTITYAIERARILRDLHDRNHRLALVTELLRTDIRNDMSMIVGWGDQLRDSVTGDERVAVEAILDASNHVLELTDTVSELMDVIAEEDFAEPQPCDLRAILTTELEQWEQRPDVDLTVDWRVRDSESVSVYGTPMLGSVFDHLLTNAVIHTDRERPTVTVTVEGTDRHVSVSIADDGVGLSAAQKKQIVDSDGTIDDRSGIGAGLYFVTTVLESIDSDLSIEDNHPRGTVVTVTFDRIGGR